MLVYVATIAGKVSKESAGSYVLDTTKVKRRASWEKLRTASPQHFLHRLLQDRRISGIMKPFLDYVTFHRLLDQDFRIVIKTRSHQDDFSVSLRRAVLYMLTKFGATIVCDIR